MTKRTILEAINTLDITENIQVGDDVVTPEDIKAEVAKMIEQLDSKAAKAKAKAAEKKSEGDALRAQIKAVITDEPKTIAEIVDELNDPEITNAKVVARLTQLVNLGEVFRSDVKIDNRKVKAYSTVEVTETVEE
jgi:hypothetical protein